MTDNSRPAPLALYPENQRPLCPICGTITFSRSGVHPQCAYQQADQRRMSKVKVAAKTAAPKVRNSLALKAWHKRCPRCKAQLHLRKMSCSCGHQFAATAAR